MTVERLNFSQPPNGYLVWFDDGWSCVCWGLEDDGQAINTSDDNLTEESATAAAWAHHEARHDPPGMAVHFIAGEGWWVQVLDHPAGESDDNHVGPTRHPLADLAEARVAAWAWYEDAVEVADLLEDGLLDDGPPHPTWFERCAWPRPLAWTAEQRAEARHWLAYPHVLAQATGVPAELPEVLRG